jgi:hypothetical protein
VISYLFEVFFSGFLLFLIFIELVFLGSYRFLFFKMDVYTIFHQVTSNSKSRMEKVFTIGGDSMKMFSIIFVSCALIGSYVCASSELAHQPKKLYVDPAAVRISKGSLSIEIDSQLIKVRKLRADEQGLYILEKDVLRSSKIWTQTYYSRCPNCGKYFYSEAQEKAHVCKKR